MSQGRWRSQTKLTGPLVACLAAFLLSACVLGTDQYVENDGQKQQDIIDRIRGIDLTPRATRPDSTGAVAASRTTQPAIFINDGGSRRSDTNDGAVANGDEFDLNFDNAPVVTVAKVILGDILGAGYTIDPRVQGNVTLTSGRPISKQDAVFVLENALRMANAGLIRDRNGYRIVMAADASGAGSVDRGTAAQPGFGLSVVPLRFVSAQTVFKLIEAFGAKANAIRADQARNILIVQGTGSERQSVIDTVLSFDADWMKGQSVGLFPVRNSSPEPLISELEKIMDSGEGGLGQNVVKLQPIARLNAILVVSQKADYLRRAGVWISRLDNADTAAANLKVYPLRYGNSRQVAALLNEIISGRTQQQDTTRDPRTPDGLQSQLAPGAGALSSSSDATQRLGMPSTGTDITINNMRGAGSAVPGQAGQPLNNQPMRGLEQGRTTLDGTGLPASGAAPGTAPGGVLQNVRITADVTNNTVLVYANRENQRIVEQTLRQIDRPQRQIAIEATIAEVTLNDSLAYGVQFFLNSKNVGLKPDRGSIVNTLGKAALERVLPGFNLLIGPEAQPNVVLDALHGITDVKVLSNPSLVVLDNQIATLQVGDQVPVSTGNATVLTANNTIVNTIDYRNTGIILRILPRSNANGNVVLEIEQEISNVGANNNVGNNAVSTLTPTISQRRVKSSISVASGQTVLLAGLISDQENRTRNGIPILDSLPYGIGDAFSHQETKKKRIELILLIRPTVVRDAIDANVVAEELRSKLNGRLIGNNAAPNLRRQ